MNYSENTYKFSIREFVRVFSSFAVETRNSRRNKTVRGYAILFFVQKLTINLPAL